MTLYRFSKISCPSTNIFKYYIIIMTFKHPWVYFHLLSTHEKLYKWEREITDRARGMLASTKVAGVDAVARTATGRGDTVRMTVAGGGRETRRRRTSSLVICCLTQLPRRRAGSGNGLRHPARLLHSHRLRTLTITERRMLAEMRSR